MYEMTNFPTVVYDIVVRSLILNGEPELEVIRIIFRHKMSK
jgi:hypothetical protein